MLAYCSRSGWRRCRWSRGLIGIAQESMVIVRCRVTVLASLERRQKMRVSVNL